MDFVIDHKIDGHWTPGLSLAVAGLFVIIDTGFLAPNSMKIAEGGYVLLLIAECICGLMLIWHRGTVAVAHRVQQTPVALPEFLADLKRRGVPRVPGTAVFLTRSAIGTPPVLLWHTQHNRALRERVVALRVLTESRLRVRWSDPLSVAEEGGISGAFRLHAEAGHPTTSGRGAATWLSPGLEDVTYYVGHESILHSRHNPVMPHWQERIFAAMVRNAAHVTDYFRLPTQRVVEIGPTSLDLTALCPA